MVGFTVDNDRFVGLSASLRFFTFFGFSDFANDCIFVDAVIGVDNDDDDVMGIDCFEIIDEYVAAGLINVVVVGIIDDDDCVVIIDDVDDWFEVVVVVVIDFGVDGFEIECDDGGGIDDDDWIEAVDVGVDCCFVVGDRIVAADWIVGDFEIVGLDTVDAVSTEIFGLLIAVDGDRWGGECSDDVDVVVVDKDDDVVVGSELIDDDTIVVVVVDGGGTVGIANGDADDAVVDFSLCAFIRIYSEHFWICTHPAMSCIILDFCGIFSPSDMHCSSILEIKYRITLRSIGECMDWIRMLTKLPSKLK